MGLVYNTNTGETEYLVKLAGGSNGPITINFAYMQDTEPSNPQEKDVWFDTTNNKIYTYKNGQWTNPKDPQVGVFYLYNDEYYLWDGNSLEKTDLNVYEKIENKTDNFVEDSSVKYPSSKALSDGLKSVEPNLYDIRTLSQAIANKGWTYLCNSTKQMLPKAKIPTVYDDVENKYLGADKTISDLLTYSINVDNLNLCYNFSSSLNKYIRLDRNSAPFKVNGSINPDLSNSSILYTHNENVYAQTLIVGKNIIIVVGYKINENIPIYVFDLNLNFLRSFTVTVPNRNSTIMANVYRKGVFFIGYNYSRGDNDQLSYMITVKDNIDVNSGTFIDEVFGYSWQGSNYFYENKSQFTDVVNDKYVYVLTQSHGSRRIYQFEISDSGDIIITNWGQYPSGTFYSNLVYFKNKFYLFNHISYRLRIYESDDCKTFTELRESPIENVGFLLSLGDNCLVVTSSAIYQTTDFETFTLVKENFSMSRDNIRNYIKTDNYFFMLGQYTQNNFIGSTLILKSYTDTYTINGSTVNIQYYKNQDWKICISDGGTNDTNLDTIYNGLGYTNYWLLDRNNEQLCLPRNSNLYTQMYVGDDYEDITTPNGNSTRLLPQSNLITDMTSTSITFDSTNKVQPNTDYEYGELTTLILDSSSIISSKLGTTIKFQSGTTATIITDNSNIQWVDRSTPEPSASKTCLIFIWDNTGFYKEW